MQLSNGKILGISFGVGLLGALIFASTTSQTKTMYNRLFTNVYGGKEFLSNEVRGLRNNNPGNIRISKDNWKGKVPQSLNTDGQFEQFISYPYGVRALIKLIQTYYYKYNCTSIKSIISRFAPINENNTKGYINNVAKSLGVGISDNITLNNRTIKILVIAIDKVENGKRTITEKHYQEALNLL